MKNKQILTIITVTFAFLVIGLSTTPSAAGEASLLLPAVQVSVFSDYFLIPPTSEAQVDYFLKLDGIEGESTDRGHEKEIEVLSWSWGASNPGSVVAGGGAGKVSMQDFHFVKRTDKSSPLLMLATATGKHFKEAVLTVRKSGGEFQEDYMKYILTDIMITSYENGGSQAIIPTDSFSMNFAKIEFQYSPVKADGSLDAPVKAGWDLKMNKGV